MTTEIIHNFCESRLNDNQSPEILNSYTSLFITFIPLIYGLPKNIIFFNISCMLLFNGFASFYYHYTLTWIGKQSDEISMILSCYFGINGLIEMNYYDNEKYKKIYTSINNIYMIIFIVLNTNIKTDKYFPYLFANYIFFVLFFINKVSNKYRTLDNYKYILNYKLELLLSFIGALSWIISEIFCNSYTTYGHIIWHFLFPLGFYKLILKYDNLLSNINSIL